MICGDCSFFIYYRHFAPPLNPSYDYISNTEGTTITMGCGLLGNEKDYNRIEGDKIASTTFKECPLKERRHVND